jgi:F420-0:gamma-glutamyl ligase-like protein
LHCFTARIPGPTGEQCHSRGYLGEDGALLIKPQATRLGSFINESIAEPARRAVLCVTVDIEILKEMLCEKMRGAKASSTKSHRKTPFRFCVNETKVILKEKFAKKRHKHGTVSQSQFFLYNAG